MQEAALRAFKSFEAFHGTDGKPWLLAIVRNTCITWAKRNQPPGGFTEFEEWAHQSSNPAENPELCALREIEKEHLRRAVESLPLEFRECLILREWEDLSYKEIAAITGVPLGTVMSRLARARKWLRQQLSDEQRNERI